MFGRIASIVVALILAIFASRSDGINGFVGTIAVSLIPLALIWFGDWLGQCT